MRGEDRYPNILCMTGWKTLKPGTNHHKNVMSWRMDLDVSLAVHMDKLSVPWHPGGELLWSPALSLKMLCIPFLKGH